MSQWFGNLSHRRGDSYPHLHTAGRGTLCTEQLLHRCCRRGEERCEDKRPTLSQSDELQPLDTPTQVGFQVSRGSYPKQGVIT